MLLFAQGESVLERNSGGKRWRVESRSVRTLPCVPVPTRHRLPRWARLERLICAREEQGAEQRLSKGESEREQTKTLLRSAMYPGPLSASSLAATCFLRLSVPPSASFGLRTSRPSRRRRRASSSQRLEQRAGYWTPAPPGSRSEDSSTQVFICLDSNLLAKHRVS